MYCPLDVAIAFSAMQTNKLFIPGLSKWSHVQPLRTLSSYLPYCVSYLPLSLPQKVSVKKKREKCMQGKNEFDTPELEGLDEIS